MNNPYSKTGEKLGYHEIYEQARQDAIRIAERAKSNNPHDDYRGKTDYNMACGDILAALKSEE